MQDKKTNKSKLTKKNVAKVAKKEFKEIKTETIAQGKAVISKAKDIRSKAKTYDWKNWKQDLILFCKNFWNSIVNPKLEVSTIIEDGNYDKEVVKTALYGLAGALISLFFIFLGGNLHVENLLKLVYLPIAAVVFLFGFAGILNMFAFYCKGTINFEIALKNTAQKMYLFPVVTLINVLSVNSFILTITSLVVDLFILYLIYTFVLFGFKGKKGLTQMVFSIFTILIIIFYFSDHLDSWLRIKNLAVMETPVLF